MEQKLQVSSCLVCDRLLPLAAKYPWLQLAPSEEHGDNVRNDPLSYYLCQIPVLMGRRIRGCFHGWVILSSHPDSVRWVLWNPSTLKTIHLPSLVLKDGDSESIGGDCCLPSPPGDTGSVLLFNRAEQRTFVFCRLDSKRKRLKWTEMTYAKQLKSITGENDFLTSLTCCNGKVYALNGCRLYQPLIQVDIVVKDEEIVITLLPFVDAPPPSIMSPFRSFNIGTILKGCTELFYVEVGVASEAMTTLTDVNLFKLDMNIMVWEKPEDLNNTIFFIDLANPGWLFYRPTVSLESGGYIHIFGKMDKVISSYNFKDNTVTLSSMPCLSSANHVPMSECRAKEEEDKEAVTRDDELVDINSTRNSLLSNTSLDVLKKIMELCVGVEYLNFRATCKQCRLAAPVIQWRKEASLRRMQTYSLPSPWLVVFDTHQGIITFTDPMFGDKYFMKTPPELIGDVRLRYSRYGWFLVYNLSHNPVTPALFNPFTNDVRKFPFAGYSKSTCFSAPPTSPDCMVVGLLSDDPCAVFIQLVNQGPDWGLWFVEFGETVTRSMSFPTLYGTDVYALEAGGRLDVYRLTEIDGGNFWEVIAEAPAGCASAAQCFLVKCDVHHLLLVRVDEYGESVEVFKLNEATHEWEKVDGLGKRMIYICGATCMCVEAKTPEMENKIYFPRLHSKSGKMIFYSLETCRYHAFDVRKVEEESFRNFVGTTCILSPHAWIKPSWC